MHSLQNPQQHLKTKTLPDLLYLLLRLLIYPLKHLPLHFLQRHRLLRDCQIQSLQVLPHTLEKGGETSSKCLEVESQPVSKTEIKLSLEDGN